MLQFSYCPLIRIFHSKKINNQINNLHERVFDLFITIKALLFKRGKLVTIHQRNIQVLLIEIFKV